jgi:Ca2+/Na+ antiporter
LISTNHGWEELPEDGIHRDFDIPNNVLGFTVAAAGTSFPNVFSGMCVARQGKATRFTRQGMWGFTSLVVITVFHSGYPLVN